MSVAAVRRCVVEGVQTIPDVGTEALWEDAAARGIRSAIFLQTV